MMSVPPALSSCSQCNSVFHMNGVACSTLVATMTSHWRGAKPCRRGSASMLSNVYSTKGKSVKRTRAWRRKTSDTSVKTYRSQVLSRTGRTLDAVPPEPAPTSRATTRRSAGSSASTASTAATTHPL